MQYYVPTNFLSLTVFQNLNITQACLARLLSADTLIELQNQPHPFCIYEQLHYECVLAFVVA